MPPSPTSTRRTCSRGHAFLRSSARPVCPKCWGGYYRKRTERGFPEELSAPALRALENAGIASLAQLAKRTEREIADLHGMGPKGIRLPKSEMRTEKLAFAQQKTAPKRGKRSFH
jgi:hypothetical protein